MAFRATRALQPARLFSAMDIPLTGIIFIPLGLLLIVLPLRFCLIGLAVFTTMSAAAVVNVGTFGLQPGYYFALLMTARGTLDILRDGLKFNAFILERLRFLFFFIGICLLVLFLAVVFFQGAVETLPGSAGYKTDTIRPFHLER